MKTKLRAAVAALSVAGMLAACGPEPIPPEQADELAAIVEDVLEERWKIYMEDRPAELHSIPADVSVAFVDTDDLRARGRRDPQRPILVDVDFHTTSQALQHGSVVEIQGFEDVSYVRGPKDMDEGDISSVNYRAKFGHRDGSWVLLSLRSTEKWVEGVSTATLIPGA
ncbi:hypothetical protein SAMN02910418_00722 [Bowdeniella nasicola]|uniref:DUF4440 domain-containing protein n=1 Tax=Bowdeniella nasicola TaxID=208480 RepID=A0A1H3XRR0_9ACTO|nr:hypothetical protein [Bowdeniella nasicola]SEA02056.1 hypothetical protein SAMN02910418_00722 [Bowdeniella nasicola]